MELVLFTEELTKAYQTHHKTPTGQCSCEAELCFTGPWIEGELKKVGLEPEHDKPQGTTI